MAMTQTREPAEVFPPGEFIREELVARDWTQEDLAQIMGRPLRLVNELVNGKKQITPETARGLGEAFSTPPLFWMNLDSAYRLSQASTGDSAVTRRAKLYNRYPVREIIKRGWIEASTNMDVLEHRVLSFFRIPSIDVAPRLAHSAKSTDYSERTPSQWAWLLRVDQLARAVSVQRYDAGKLRAALAELKGLMVAPEEIRQVPSILARAGVRFVIVEFLPGSKIDGAALWLDTSSPVIALSLRFDRVDNFWFVLRHEIEHILRGDGRDGEEVVDVELSEKIKSGEVLPPEEAAANSAASEFCVDKAEMNSFISRVRPLYSEQRILLFSKRIGVHPGLVVGQLHHRKEVPYTHFQKYLVKVRDTIIETALTDGWKRVPPILSHLGE